MDKIVKPKEVSYNDLPTAIAYLIQEVETLKALIKAQQQPVTVSKREHIDIERASRVIKKSKKTIYTLTCKKLIPHYKMGKKLYFYEDELLDWIDKGKRLDRTRTILTMQEEIKQGVRRKPTPLPW